MHPCPWYLAQFSAESYKICPYQSIFLLLLSCSVQKTPKISITLLKYKPEEKFWSASIFCYISVMLQKLFQGTLCLAVLAASVLYYLLSAIFHLDLEERFQLSDSSDCSGSNLSKGIHHITRKDVVWGSKNIIPFDSPKLQACPLRAASCWE